MFSFFHLLVWFLLCFLLGKELDISYLFIFFSFNTDKMPISGALWFLTSLSFVDIIYYLIDRISNMKLKYGLIILSFVVGAILPNYFRLPLALNTSLMGIGLFHIGRLYKQYEKRINYFLLFSSVALVTGSILTFFNGYINVRLGIYSNILLYLITVSLMTWGYSMSKYLGHYKIFILAEMKSIGRNSLVYVCLNQLFLLFFNQIGKLLASNFLLLFVYKVTVLIIVIFILHIVTLICSVKELKWIIGK